MTAASPPCTRCRWTSGRGENLRASGTETARAKTTLIGTICGLVQPSGGRVTVAGHDTAIRVSRRAQPDRARASGGQSRTLRERSSTRCGSRAGLFGKPRNEALIEHVLRQLSLWDKRDSQIRALSGGYEAARADRPRRWPMSRGSCSLTSRPRAWTWNCAATCWEVVRGLKEDGVTIILTTHYIEEAEAMADRVGVITRGRLLLVEDKDALMSRLGRKELVIELREPLKAVPDELAGHGLEVLRGRTLAVSPMTRRPSARGSRGFWPPCRRRGFTCATGGDADLVAGGESSSDSSPRKTGLTKAGRPRHEPARHRRHLPLRNEPDLPHAGSVCRLAGADHVAVFSWSSARPSAAASREVEGRELRCLHRAGADHADGAAAGDQQCVLRDLLPEIRGDDLRASFGARVPFSR